MNGSVSYCEGGCGRPLSNDTDGDGNLIEPFMCWECDEAQNAHYEENRAS